ncbi:electron transfer flavoprotein subunit alpha/FixB family protein [Methylophaga sp. OBS4]|uniref:electron transfer flavoprotein subunit alpha/FixB family protein n=1 Tax=Methylophaga sp. OBS4 TaxID=2991935 RepID=UPI002254A000|nr:electron transfer flavoprotein subunit alpha/FixB family protein [Methylophaga sp. OBS4]MCX4187740.1 electron transfer flavoprotein subunit alpha/FixB family protein [Methylophaga sp. OBS4]MCX4187741.1 electron transfer flavoprotein subunit alpha/FixB family protein [Methylophaga sp. OBS4]
MKRINPRRPWIITTEGLRRIVLGAIGDGAAPNQAMPTHTTVKPVRTPAEPGTWLLVIAHSDRGALDDHAREALAAAAILAAANTAVAVLVLGELREDLSEAGADRVLVAEHLSCEHFQPEAELACVNAVIADLHPVRIFMPDNAYGDGDLGRRLIASNTFSAATHVVELNAKQATTLQQGGSQMASCALPDIVLLAKDSVDSKLPFTGLAKREAAPQASVNTSAACQDLGVQTIAAADIALEEADRIVSAGNGVQHVDTLETLAQTLDAAVGASRVAVDDGKFPRSKQIGATGKTVTASTYIAIGISGAVQHLQGIKACRHVIAINRDASAPMVARANLSVIGDAEEVMQGLIRLVEEVKQAQS